MSKEKIYYPMIEPCRFCMNFINCAKDLTQASNCSKASYAFYNPESRVSPLKMDKEKSSVTVTSGRNKNFIQKIFGDRFDFINNIVEDKKKIVYIFALIGISIFIISQYVDLSAIIGIAIIGGAFYIIKMVKRYKELALGKIKKKKEKK